MRVGVCLVAVAVVVRTLAAQDWNPGIDLLAGERGERRKGERKVIRGREGGREGGRKEEEEDEEEEEEEEEGEEGLARAVQSAHKSTSM